MSDVADERCGGSGVLPQGGHEGTTRYACPGCPDCTPDPEGEEWTAARRIHAGEECDVVELLDSCPRCYGEVSNPERFGLGQICDFCLGDEDVHVIRAHRLAQSLSLADRYRQERDKSRRGVKDWKANYSAEWHRAEAAEAEVQRLRGKVQLALNEHGTYVDLIDRLEDALSPEEGE